MSNWQREQAGSPGTKHGETKSELQRYKETFGELPGEGTPPASRPPAKPAPSTPPSPNDDPDAPPALREGWAPKNVQELQQGIREAAEYGAKIALKTISQQSQAAQEAEQQVQSFVDEVKGADPDFNETEFFAYATKYRFPLNTIQDLRSVYVNYVDRQREIRTAEARGAKGREQRREPVNVPGAGPGTGPKVPFSRISKAASAQDLVHDMLREQGGTQ